MQKKTHIIAFTSGKGGTGKSVISSNLASILASAGHKCLIWDADSMFPNLHLLCSIDPPVRLAEVYAGNVALTSAIYKISERLHILADQPASGLTQFYSETPLLDAWLQFPDDTDYDFIILDCPAGAGSMVLQSCYLADTVVVMMTDEPTSLIDGYGLIKILKQNNLESKVKLLVNNVIDDEDANEMFKKMNLATEHFLQMQFNNLGYIIYDRIVRKSIMNQELFTDIMPECAASKDVAQLKDLIISLTE